jgi:hypothetical protein
MTPIKFTRAPLTKRISALAVTAAAALTLAAFSPNAHAAPKPPKELVALANALNTLFPGQNVNVANANADQLGAAVSSAITTNPTYNPGFIAGEALKNASSNAQDGGDEIGAALRDAPNTPNDFNAARDAIKRAGSGSNLNVSLVPDFTREFVASETQALALAKTVIKTKPGAGAVIGGWAADLFANSGTVATVTTFTNTALTKSNGISAAAQDILKYVVVAVDDDGSDTAAFTNVIAGTNIALATKIGTGGVAGDPTNGGAIVNALLSNASLPKLKSGVAGFIKSVGKVADLEELTRIAIAVGNQINVDAGKTTAIKLASANGIVKSLAKAVMAKGTTPPPASVAPNSTPDYSFTNKQDEIAEIAAFMVAKMLNNLTIGGTATGKAQITAKNGGAKIMAIIKSAAGVAKGKKVAAAAGSAFYLNVVQDVTGSVAETLGELKETAPNQLFADTIQAIKDYLSAKSSQIAGAANASSLKTLIDLEYLPVASTRFEDGTLNASPTDNSVPDPFAETDFRPF